MTSDTRIAGSERVVQEILGPVRRFARRIAGADRAEDVVSETVLAVLQSLRDGRPPRRAVSYALAVAWRRAAEIGRNESRRPLPLEDDAAGAAFRAERLSELREWIGAALEAIPPADAAVIHLFYEEELDYREIGRILGTSAGSVGRRLHEARTRFAAALERLGEPARVPVALAFLPALSARITSAGSAVAAARWEPVSWFAGGLLGGWTMKKLARRQWSVGIRAVGAVSSSGSGEPRRPAPSCSKDAALHAWCPHEVAVGPGE